MQRRSRTQQWCALRAKVYSVIDSFWQLLTVSDVSPAFPMLHSVQALYVASKIDFWTYLIPGTKPPSARYEEVFKGKSQEFRDIVFVHVCMCDYRYGHMCAIKSEFEQQRCCALIALLPSNTKPQPGRRRRSKWLRKETKDGMCWQFSWISWWAAAVRGSSVEGRGMNQVLDQWL